MNETHQYQSRKRRRRRRNRVSIVSKSLYLIKSDSESEREINGQQFIQTPCFIKLNVSNIMEMPQTVILYIFGPFFYILFTKNQSYFVFVSHRIYEFN